MIIPTSTNYLEGKATSNEFTISQAEMTITMKTEYNEMWREGLTLNSLKPADTENGAYEWTNATVGLDASLNVGSYTLQLVYTPKDSNNYKTLTKDVTVNVTPKLIDLPTLSVSKFTYNGSVQKPDVAENADYSIVYEDTTSTNVGNYNVTLTLNSTNYKWNDTENGLTRTLTYSIEKAILSWNDFTFRFNGTEMTTQSCSTVYGTAYTLTIEPKANASFAVLTAKYTGNGYDSEDQPTNAGTYTVSFTENSDNYDVGGEAIKLTLTIAKANLTLTATVDYTAATEGYYYENELDSSMLKDITTASATGVRGEEVTGNLSDGRNLTFNGDNSTFTVTFTPNNANYNAATIDVTIKLKGVAYIGSTYYGTIEAALAAATSGQTVYVVPDVTGKVVIKEDCTIGSGVTLCLPYEGTTWEDADQNNSIGSDYFADQDEDKVKAYRKSLVTMSTGATLTVNSNATLQVGGYIGVRSGGQSPTGHTYLSYAEILMQENAKIISYGMTDCRGYVKETERNNGSMVEIVNGTMYMPYVIYDYRGGSDTACVYRAGDMAPFSVYDMPNVQSFFTIHSAATLVGYADLFASNVHNTTEIKIIAKSKAVLNLTAGTATLKYTPQINGFTTHYEGNDFISLDKEISLTLTNGTILTYARGTIFNLAATDIQICGDAHLGSMSMEIMGVPVKTSDVMFPISWKQQITLRNGTYEISNPFKMLSGSIICVEEGATLNAKGSMIIYPKSSSDPAYRYIKTDDIYHFNSCNVTYPTKDAAQLLVKGRLDISDSSVNSAFGGFGGMVTAASENAVVNVTSSTSNLTSTSKESSGTVTGLESLTVPKVEIIEVITKQLQLLSYGKKLAGQEEYFTSAGTYYGAQCADGTFGWYPAKVSISYETNGGNTIAPVTHDTSPNGVGYTVSAADLPTPTKTGTEFLGWYLDVDCTDGMEANGKTIYADTILYAKWSKQTFIVNFASEVDGNVDFNKTVSDLAQGTTISSDQFPTIDHSKYSNNVTYQYFYTGSWYYYENGVKVPFTSETRINRNFTVYAEYTEKVYIHLSTQKHSGFFDTYYFDVTITIDGTPYEFTEDKEYSEKVLWILPSQTVKCEAKKSSIYTPEATMEEIKENNVLVGYTITVKKE